MDTISNLTNITRNISFDIHQIEVRVVKEDEVHYVADIITHSFHFDRGWRAWFTPLFKLGIAEDLRHRLRTCNTNSGHSQIQQQVCSIALYGEPGQTQVVGTVEVGLRTTAHERTHSHRYAYISNLAVSRDFRRRGVAHELLSNCEQITKSWGYTEIYLHVMADNHRGLSLYRKLGYQVISSERIWSWIPWWHRPERLFMRKQLLICPA